MEGMNNSSESEINDDLEVIIERPEHRASDEHAIDEQFIDHLLKDEPKIVDHSLDKLFEEERQNLTRGLQDELQKALSQPQMSKASLFRMKLSNPDESAFVEEIATLKSVEEIWEEEAQSIDKKSNRKSIIVIRISIIFFILFFLLIFACLGGRGNARFRCVSFL